MYKSDKQKESQSINEMSCNEARDFLLKHKSYYSNDLPTYYQFGDVLKGVERELQGKNLPDLWHRKPRNHVNVNHLMLDNKDGRYAWRPLELIHPALYVSLVKKMTEEASWQTIRQRLGEFASNSKIRCLSIPVESLTEEKDKAAQVSKWWREDEQKSIELFLDYDFLIQTDIVDCYASIYTHSIAWALHTKVKARESRNDNTLVGNSIDSHIQDMRNGQTNGIPQGSVLMDFIAELVLGYADSELTAMIDAKRVSCYQILRYRDDYRIFVNSRQDGERILKCLAEVLLELGLRLSPAKTMLSQEVIRSSMKPDKLRWLFRKQGDRGLQKHLLIIHDHSLVDPNSGSLTIALNGYYRRLHKCNENDLAMPLISIVVDIALRSPRNYPVAAAILGKLVRLLETEADQQDTIERIRRRFSQIPNTGQLEIWLQRVFLEFGSDIHFKEPLCQLVQGSDVRIWNSEWISAARLRRAVDPKGIVDQEELNQVKPLLPIEEVELYGIHYF